MGCCAGLHSTVNAVITTKKTLFADEQCSTLSSTAWLNIYRLLCITAMNKFVDSSLAFVTHYSDVFEFSSCLA